MSRLTIDITSQQHQSLKALADLQDKSIKQYTLERLFRGNAAGDQAWSEVKPLLRTRIDEGLRGKGSINGMQSILNEELTEGGRA
ncbi:hypothetical protein HDE76_003864 [Rhodanobacter sp. ANJX3]|uniref:antitoxin n=1 Tax=Rhodanobacter sp. ANJX3 TaxID=2723083 RepID=UPI0016177AFF|nr:antitoxin [Rhodanobacter sp. ANJX3]MBB5360619.1 hypothetical protein [Rhodanobacter sp. ANJX3]